MWRRIRQIALYLLIGFTVAFVAYLFIRFDADQVLLGMVIGAVAGIAVAVFLLWFERRYPGAAR